MRTIPRLKTATTSLEDIGKPVPQQTPHEYQATYPLLMMTHWYNEALAHVTWAVRRLVSCEGANPDAEDARHTLLTTLQACVQILAAPLPPDLVHQTVTEETRFQVEMRLQRPHTIGVRTARGARRARRRRADAAYSE